MNRALLIFTIVTLCSFVAFATVTQQQLYKFDADTTAVKGVIAKDSANNLWVSTNNGIVKFSTTGNGRTGRINLLTGEGAPTTLVIDSSSTYGYFTTSATVLGVTTAYVVQFSVQNVSRVGLPYPLFDHEQNPVVAHFNAAQTKLYIGLDTAQTQIVELAVPNLSRTGAITLQNTEKQMASAVLDSVRNIVYYGTASSTVVSVDLSNFRRLKASVLAPITNFVAAGIDVAAGHIFYGTSAGVVHKVSFDATGTVTYGSNVALATTETVTGVVVDTTHIFVLQDRAPARVHKMDKNLGAGTILDLTPATETNGKQLIMEGTNLWVSCEIGGATPVTMVKVASVAFTRTLAAFISEAIDNVRMSARDAAGNFLLVNNAATSVIYQVRPDSSIQSKFTLDAGDKASAISFRNGKLYVAAEQGGACQLYTLDAAGSLTLPTAKVAITNVSPVAAVFADSSFMYVAGGTTGIIARLPLGTTDPLTAVKLQLLSSFQEDRFVAAAVDSTNSFVWLVTSNAALLPSLIKVRLADFVRVSVAPSSANRQILGTAEQPVKAIDISPDDKYLYILSDITGPPQTTRITRISIADGFFNKDVITRTGVDHVNPLSIAANTQGDFLFVTTQSGTIFVLDAHNTFAEQDLVKYTPAAGAFFTRARFINNYYFFVASAATPSSYYAMTFCPPGYVLNGVTCNKCLAGFYQASATSCHVCPAGAYCPTDGLTNFVNCPAGTASAATQQTSNSTCVPCVPGFYSSSSGQAACLPCPAGRFCPDPSTVAPTLCPAGYYSNNTQQTSNATCTPCGHGYYQTVAGSTSCTACSAGKYSQQIGASVNPCKNCYPGSTSDVAAAWCHLCAPGTSNNAAGGTCSVCGKGTYSDSYGATSCASCPSGSYQDQTGATHCIHCSPGTSRTGTAGQTPCVDCIEGTYQALTGQETCLNCPAGTYNNNTKQTACHPCPAGFSSGTLNGADGQEYCAACPAGTFAPTNGTPKCFDCPAGSYSTSYNSSSCQLCPPGYFQANPRSTGCVPCAIGKYSSKYGSTTCTNCPAGTVNNAAAATTCQPCGPGFVARAVPGTPQVYFCDICPAGMYSDQQTASGACVSCQGGYYQPFPGSASCLKCPAGHFSAVGSTQCTPCAVGTYADDTATTCTTCPVNTYAPTIGSVACTLCPAGYESATGQSQCIACPKGRFNDKAGGVCRICASGTFGPDVGAVQCKTCPAGSFSATSATSCTKCTPGNYQSNSGSTSCNPCPQGSYSVHAGATSCALCPVGTSATAQQQECTVCPLGKFADTPGSFVCRDCPSGTWTWSERSSQCFSCPSGSYLTATTGNYKTCSPCDLGTYNSRTGGSTGVECNKCPVGTYQDTYGQDSCKSCPAGTFAAGTANKGVSDCLPCAAGTFSEGGASACRACPLGSISSPRIGGTTCKWCPAGTVFHVDAAVSSCVPCPAGTFNPTEGVHNQAYTTLVGGANSPIGFLGLTHNINSFVQSCLPCPAGTYAAFPGSPSCSACPVSSYASTNGSTKCTPCPGNTYTSRLGAQNFTDCVNNCNPGFVATYNQTSGSPCVPCAAGTFFDTRTGACSACAVGQYQNLPAQLQCKPCNSTSAATPGQATCQVCVTTTFLDSNGQPRNTTECKEASAFALKTSVALLFLAMAVALLAAFMH